MGDFVYSEGLLKKVELILKECNGCGRCKDNCEMLSTFNINPKKLIKIAKKINPDPIIPYSCNMCGTCTHVCPNKIRLQDVFFEMRKELIKNNNGKSPIKGHKAIALHQSLSFSKIFNTAVSDEIAGFTKAVFIPGCSLASYSPKLVGKTLAYLQQKLPGTGAILKCCGNPTLSLGLEEKFNKRYSQLEKEIENLGAEVIITACQNCFTTISKFSPKLKVKSLWTVIANLGLTSEMKNKGKLSDITFSIHDSCSTRYNSEIQDSVRWIINELGYKVNESPLSRENTVCCGYGGMIVPANPKLSLKVMKKSSQRYDEDYIITYCASCREAQIKGGKKALHILDLIFNDTYYKSSKINGLNKSFIQNWTKRYRSKKNLESFTKYKEKL